MVNRTPLLAPLHTLTAAHSFSYTCFLKPPINNEGCSQPRLGGREKGHYRPGLHLSKLFHNLRSQGGFLLKLIVGWTTEHKFPLAIILLVSADSDPICSLLRPSVTDANIQSHIEVNEIMENFCLGQFVKR